MDVVFNGWKCHIVKSEYKNGGTALLLKAAQAYPEQDIHEDDDIAVASVWLPAIKEGEVAIKDYSENEGMLQCLRDAGVVSEPVCWEHSGFVDIPICKLLI